MSFIVDDLFKFSIHTLQNNIFSERSQGLRISNTMFGHIN